MLQKNRRISYAIFILYMKRPYNLFHILRNRFCPVYPHDRNGNGCQPVLRHCRRPVFHHRKKRLFFLIQIATGKHSAAKFSEGPALHTLHPDIFWHADKHGTGKKRLHFFSVIPLDRCKNQIRIFSHILQKQPAHLFLCPRCRIWVGRTRFWKIIVLYVAKLIS